MASRIKEIKGIITEFAAGLLYLLLTFLAAAVFLG
jgi:hypothetical protein